MKRLTALVTTAIVIALLTTVNISIATETSTVSKDDTIVTTPTEVKYTPKYGTVTFNHTKHQSRADCVSCHHTGTNTQCKSCHGVEENTPTAKKAFHNQCKGCHKERKLGPKSCKECHKK